MARTDAFEVFADITDVVSAALHARLDAHPTPAALFHYTDAAGLVGILRTGRLWATHNRHLNDLEEGVYAENLVRELFLEGLPEFPEIPRTANEWATQVRYQVAGSKTDERVIPHVSCLTPHGDVLSQWRAYGANGHGFSIGFGTGDLDLEEHIQVERVEYERPVQRGIIAEMLTVASKRLADRWQAEATDSHAAWTLSAGASGAILGFIPVAAATFKHDGFREETEWRIIVPAGAKKGMPTPRFAEDAEIRVSGARRIPYFPVRLRRDGRLPIREVVLGPAHEPSAAEFVRTLLGENGYDGSRITICKSRIPYRP